LLCFFYADLSKHDNRSLIAYIANILDFAKVAQAPLDFAKTAYTLHKQK